MTEHYQLIYDIDQIQKFADMFYDTQYVQLIYMAARRKYNNKQSKEGATCFYRQLVTNKNIIDMIRRYEIPTGSYKSKNGEIIENNALVVYFLLNPRNMIQAYTKFTNQISERMSRHIQGNEQEYNDLESQLKSCIHSSIDKKPYVELDIDTKDPDIFRNILNIVLPLKQHIICTIETRGGYHIIMNNNTITKKEKSDLWQSFKLLTFESIDFNGNPIIKSYVDIRSDPSPPIPGTIQGGFPVKFVSNF